MMPLWGVVPLLPSRLAKLEQISVSDVMAKEDDAPEKYVVVCIIYM